MFGDGSTFKMVMGVPKMVGHLSNASRYDPKLTVKTMKDPDSVMVWVDFSRNLDQAGLYFLT